MTSTHCRISSRLSDQRADIRHLTRKRKSTVQKQNDDGDEWCGAAGCSHSVQGKRKKRVWMRKWLERRGQQGLSVLQRELELEDRSGFREMLRMTSDEFDVLLEMVGPLITRQDTKMRMAITARERLSLTLRFLATVGETYKSPSFQYWIGATTISTIVKETCEALHQVLKDDFLKTPKSEGE